MSFLTPCHTCNRHVLASDRDCPFCGAAVTEAMRARVPRRPQGRLGRAALMAFSATVATTACGGSEDSDDTRQPAKGNTTDPSNSTQPTPAAPSGTMGAMPNMPGSGGASPHLDARSVDLPRRSVRLAHPVDRRGLRVEHDVARREVHHLGRRDGDCNREDRERKPGLTESLNHRLQHAEKASTENLVATIR